MLALGVVQVSQDYNFFIDGIPLELWDALPLKLKEGTQRPPGGVNLHFLGTHLHPGQEVERGADGERYTKETPALQRVVAAIKENKTKHPGLKPCVISMRWAAARCKDTLGAFIVHPRG